MVLRLLFVLLFAVLAGCSAEPDIGAGSTTPGAGTLIVDGRERHYRVRVPEGVAGRLPVVLVLHGGGGNGRQVEQQTGMSVAAHEAGFIAVYPEGTGRTSLLTWNAGDCCGYAQRENVDEVAFVSALLDEVFADYPADPARVYVTGMSNGAMMAYQLACELSDRIAGIAPVAGALNVTPCRPTRPVPVLAIHGTADEVVPYEGGPPTRQLPGGETWANTSVADSVGFWAKHNECTSTPEVTEADSVTVTDYGPCHVVLYTVKDGGHAWPGGTQPRSAADRVPPTPDATRVILNFFATA
jgi:polyhydroxybutyrate depolymerase